MEKTGIDTLRKIVTYFCIGLAITLLHGCGSTNTQPSNAGKNRLDIEQLRSSANFSSTQERNEAVLESIDKALQEKNLSLASKLLQLIQHPINNNPLYAQYLLLATNYYLASGEFEAGLELLQHPEASSRIGKLEKLDQLAIGQAHSHLLARTGSHVASARKRIFLTPLLVEASDLASLARNEREIWQSLVQVDTDTLSQLEQQVVNEEFTAWIQLALIAKAGQGDLFDQLAMLNEWQQRWPEHPGGIRLPADLNLINELANNQPRAIAVLLPLSGKLASYGQSIRDGILAAAFEAKTKHSRMPQIKIYDTSTHVDIVEIYERAVANGAETIIGPLQKSKIGELLSMPSLPVPTLALNRLTSDIPPTENLYQFGLSPLDEAEEIAEIALLENHQTALVIAMAGPWADDIVQHFGSHWDSLGGKILDIGRYQSAKEYSKLIKNRLNVSRSEGRAKQLQSIIGRNIEFQPRQRKDIDMIFLLARPEQARTIKPLLAYHYGGDIPVYATSRTYSGHYAPQDRDLTGIRFVDAPWVIKSSKLKRAIESVQAKSRSNMRMLALGIDSFTIHPRLSQLKQISDSRFYGQTGVLKMNEQKQLIRDLQYAYFSKGKAKKRARPTATLTEQADASSALNRTAP